MSDFVQFGTTTGFAIPILPGPGGDQGVLRFAALAADETVLVTPGLGLTGTIGNWTLGFDMLVPPGQGRWTSLLQTTLANNNDGELFIRAGTGGTGGIGIASVYDGSFQYGAWQRVVFTAEEAGAATTLRKYIDGVLVGTQPLTGTRWKLDADDGFLILSDNDGEVSAGFLSSFLFAPAALTGADIAALGGADADGFFATPPVAGASQFDFAEGTYDARFGPARLAAPGDEDAPLPPLVLVNRIADVMQTPGSTVTIDLAGRFSRDGLSFSIANDDAAVVTAAVIDGETLTLSLGALGHADLRLVATATDGNTAADAFRVRAAGPNAYTIAVLPDTQDYTDASLTNGTPETFYAMTEWLVANRAAKNIVFAVHVGDITQDNLASHWEVANRALSTLDGRIPYSLSPGNHDHAAGGTAADHSADFLDALFSPARQAASNPGTFGGTYDQEPERSANTFHTFAAPDGTDWLVVALEFGPRDDVLRWAGDVIGAHLDHQVIITSHALTNWPLRHDPAGLPLYDEGAGADYGMGRSPEGANDGETVFRELLAGFPNIAMTFSGHIFGDGAESTESFSQHGNRILESLVNYQNGVAREITGNGDPALGGQGGNGAIRLVTVDPDNDRVTTETYFTAFDDYLDGFRVSPDLGRDGLTGRYRGHEEVFEGWSLSTPAVRAVADAGDDRFVAAGPGEGTATVMLDAGRTRDPGGVASTHVWLDRDGDTVATGATAEVALGIGRHTLTLVVTDTLGNVTTDGVLVVATGDRTLLFDSFNDGDIAGWAPPGADDGLVVGSPESFGLPTLPGGPESVLELPALPPTRALTLSPNLGAPQGTLVGDYSLVMDILVPDGQGTWTALWQTDVNNASDGDLFIRSRGDGTGGIGISARYDGNFDYGAWQRVGFVFDDLGNGTTTLAKYIEGALVGTQTLSGDRWKLDVGRGALLFSDEDGETSDLFVSSVLVTDRLFSAAEMATLGGARAGGILAAPPSPVSVQFDFGDASLAATWGVPTLGFGAAGTGSGSFIVKGTVFSRPTAEPGMPAPEARVFDQSDAEDNVLLWAAEEALAWQDYRLGFTLRSTDNDGIGAVFNWQDAANHHRVVLDGEANALSLIRVTGGAETVLAAEAGSTRFNTDQTLEIVTLGGGITVFLDGRLLFGGTVTDPGGPAAGTVGFWSDTQRSSQFDTVTVEAAALDAHAGDDRRLFDRDGDGAATVLLSAAGTTGPAAIVAWEWHDASGNLRGTGAETAFDLAVGQHALTLTVTDTTGATATDRVDVEVVGRSRLLLDEGFAGRTVPADWRIADEGEFGGLGPDGRMSDWRIAGGALTQFSDLASRQLTWNGASNADVWQRGWSPHGDGVNVLRKGTYALYDGADAASWRNVAVEARIVTPDNDGLGLLFRYQDENNHYKLELDAEGVYDRNPRNGAGPLFTLTRLEDGVEQILAQVPRRYTPGEAFDLRVELREGRIEAFIDGWEIFAYAIEDRAHDTGTIGLYSWGSAGVAFDDVSVVSLDAASEPVLLPVLTFLQGAAGTPTGSIPAAPVAPAAQVARRVTVEAEDGTTTIENVFAWNEMKVVVFEEEYYVPAMGTSFTLANFVDVRFDLSAAIEAADLLVWGAKRGSITGGDLGDAIAWTAHSNEGFFSNRVAIDAGAGNDTVTLAAVGGFGEAADFLADNADPANGPLWNAAYRGAFTRFEITLGEGEDRLVLNRDAGRVAVSDFGADDLLLLAGFAAGATLAHQGGGTWRVSEGGVAVGQAIDLGLTTLVAGEDYLFV